jgi:hypothetical protein
MTRSTGERQVERLVGNIAESREYLVTYRQGGMIGLLDPVTGQSTESARPPGIEVQSGSKVRAMQDGDRIVLLGSP